MHEQSDCDVTKCGKVHSGHTAHLLVKIKILSRDDGTSLVSLTTFTSLSSFV